MKKGLALLALFLLTLFQFASADEETCSPALLGAPDVSRSSEGLTRVLINGKYGYVDSHNRLVIPAEYEAADEFYNDLAGVKEKGKWEVINGRGKVLRPWTLTTVRPQHWLGPIELITPVLESQGRTIDARFLVYAVNRNNDVFKNLEALQSDPASPLLPVKIGGLWGYVERRISLDNPQDSIAIVPQYQDAKPYSDGLAAVEINGKWGYIDNGGNRVIKPAFDEAQSFERNLALVSQGDKLLTIDKSGKPLLSCRIKGNPFLSLTPVHPVMNIESAGTFAPGAAVMGAPEKE